MPVLEPFWRRQAELFSRPKPYGFPGKIIARLLEHIAKLEAT